MSQQTMVNGNRYSFVNITVDIAGLPQPRVFTSVNYDAAQDPGIVQANQVTIVGRTSGYGTANGGFEMLVSEWDDLNANITNGGFYPTMSAPDFDITVSYAIANTVRTDVLQGCRITAINTANAQGNNASTKAITLSIARLYLNGIAAFGDPQGV